jgi:hypothetical protein
VEITLNIIAYVGSDDLASFEAQGNVDDPNHRRGCPLSLLYAQNQTVSNPPKSAMQPNRARVRLQDAWQAGSMTDAVKVFGCRPSLVAGLGVGRRTETAQVRTRGGTSATLWGFEDSGVAAAVARRLCSEARLRHRAEKTVCDCTVVARPRRQTGRSGGYQRCGRARDWRGRVSARWPKRHGFDGDLSLVVPGHDSVIPDMGNEGGGARAWAAPRNTSMMTMRPPQHGHGGRGCGGGSGCSASGGGTASSARASATLTLRRPLASRP